MSKDREPLKLSPREEQLIRFAAEGLTDTAIAFRLGISEATVGTYWGRVRIKIGPYNRTELVSIFLRQEQETKLDAIREENAQVVAALQSAVSEAAVQDSLYRDLIDNAPDAMLLVLSDGVISTANQAAHELFGYDGGEMNGLSLITLVPERFREVHQDHRAQYVADPRRRTMGEHLDTPAVRKDNTEMTVQASLSAVNTPTGLLVICAVRPVNVE